MTTKRTWMVFASMLALAACGGGDVPGTDSGTDVDAGGNNDGAPTCEAYCDVELASCSGANAQYADRAECIEVCQTAGWAAGDPVTTTGPASGNTIACRTYHGGAPAAADPETHCPHSGETGANTCGSWCEAYCSLALGACTGDDAIYTDGETCMAACEAFDDHGDLGDTGGDTVQCRLYHLGAAIRTGDTAMHCPHAAPDGGGVCVGGWDFRTDDPSAYTRVDRMGMPAVSTALVSDTGGTEVTKNDYNDGDPSDDVAGTYAPELVANLTALHGALDDDLAGLDLVPCAMTPAPNCLTQEVAPDVNVQSLVVPDTITVDTSAAAGFPNGRRLTDPAIDVTLAVILLDLTATGQTPATLAGVPVNPDQNDATFGTEFPYLAAPHTP